jgi:hypothetical protein
MKIIKGGIFSEELDLPKKPPAGLWGTCQNCRAILETCENEPLAKVSKRRNQKGIYLPGWNIPCPECSRSVFFADPNPNQEKLRVLNGWISEKAVKT